MMKGLVYLKDVVTLDVIPEKCTGCRMCLLVCPHDVLAMTNGRVCIDDRDACMECGACARNCPTGAVTVRSGVGCAAAIINAALGRDKSPCCCVVESKENSEDPSAPPEGSGHVNCC